MASMKSWISPDLLSHDACARNFILFSQQLSFYLQQHFIFAAIFKAITESIFIMQRVLFLKKYLNLKQLLNLQQLLKIAQLLKLQQKLTEIAATFKIAAEIIKNCSNF